MRKKLVAVLGGILLLTGCSAISSGTITGKVYEEAHSYYTTICHLVGKVTVCTPTYQYDDADWRFDIKDDKDTGWVYVSEETYNSYEVGDYFQADE